MMDSLEGIECLLLAASFHADSGNLRAAWSIIRRAMLTAQLMCLHRQKRPPLKTIQSKTEWNPQLLWYKIIYYDRFFSLILGLPQGSMDNSMGAPSALVNDTPMGRLERRHCVLASRILLRNDTDFNTPDELDTLAIDKELRQLAESMPSKWWLIPNLAYMKDSDDLFWTTVRLTNQVFHYILLSHLHLPYLLLSGDHEYSRVACVNASRDMLHRYMGFRTFNSVLYCCHSMDFFAITASMTLILAHLSQSGSGSALVHQRTSDRALMEEILDNMEQVGTLSKVISISERGAGVLRRLLVIEADAASGSRYRLEAGETNDTRALRLNFPYFGTITITQYTPEVSERPLGSERTAEEAPRGNLPDLSAGGMSSLSTGYVNAASAMVQPNGAVDTGSGGLSFGESLGQEDWEFQDANMSFFDALMKESDAQMAYWWLQ
ncbi:hypothetical protein F4821DRAFT_242906 [Hypoxylon rubiginosum]|uniref:Uncharacterized protein n=1 Tax=Hypoxylon rubiginosum TaxID=110542 RepID=A0ACC0CVN3_9PEZI|nr:hypothetical protein F4821DRAFT_242906 [Hypoxylon rubiginosum]